MTSLDKLFAIGIIVAAVLVVVSVFGPSTAGECSRACMPMIMTSFTPAVPSTGVGCVGTPSICKCSDTVRR